jgi:hypothetical protein
MNLMIPPLLTTSAAILGAALAQPVARPAPAPTPEVMIVAPGSAISLEPSGGAGGAVEARLDGGLLTPAERIAVPEAGDHWLVVGSRDAVGGLSSLRWVRLRVDSAAPSLSFSTEPARVADAAGALWGAPGTLVVATAEDPLSGVREVRLRCGENSSDGTANARATVKATASCEASATDKVSNRATLSETIRIDSLGPRTEIQTEGPTYRDGDRLFLGPAATLKVNVSDLESGVSSWGGFVDSAAREPQAFAGPFAEGPHEVSVEARDRVGNTTRTPPLAFTVDAAPPKIAWRIDGPSVVNTAGESVYRSPVRIVASAQDGGAGLTAFVASENGASFEAFTDARVSGAEGMAFRATDRVGNVSEVKAAWRVDAAPPVISIDGAAQSAEGRAEIEVVAGQALRLSASDDASGVARFMYALDGSRLTAAPVELRFLDPGEFGLTLEASDVLGNPTRVRRHVRVRRAR